MAVVEEVTSASPGDIVLLKGSAQNQSSTSVNVLLSLINKKNYAGIYVTVNKPYDNISGQLRKKGVKTDRLFFIDAVTKIVISSPNEAPNCLYTTSPKHLQEISVALSKIAVKNPAVKFLVLDSISTLLLYNDIPAIKKFLHFLTTALRQLKMVGVLLVLNKKDSDVIEFSETLCDKCLALGGAA